MNPNQEVGAYDINWLLAKLVGQRPTSIYKLTPIDSGVVSFMRNKVDLVTNAVTSPMMLYRFYLWYCDRMQYPASGFLAFYKLLVRHMGVPRIMDGERFMFRCRVKIDRLDIGMEHEAEIAAAEKLIHEAERLHPLTEGADNGG